MPPLRYDRRRIDELLDRAVARLTGDWLLIGGAAAAMWFAPARTTEDIDMIGLGGTPDERFALMTFAADAGLPIEAVNSAADFFVRRIPGWRDDLAVLRRGESATIYRPNATLFLLLKLARLTASDLDDCIALLAHGRSTGAPEDRIDVERVRAALAALPATDDAALGERRHALADALAESAGAATSPYIITTKSP